MGPVHCIYHGGCPDGFTAAWVVEKAIGHHGVTYHEGSYGTPPPADIPADATVYIVDFSYPRAELVELASRVSHVCLFDHHASAERDLDGIGCEAGMTVVFDMERSGAGITWDQMFPGEPRHGLVDYVEDRDLWRYALPHSEDIAPIFMATPFTFEHWSDLADGFTPDGPTPGALSNGRVLRQMREKVIAEIAATARPMRIAEWTVQVAGSPYAFGSDVGGALCAGRPFGAYYVDRPEGRQFGLRSDDQGLDVSLVAAEFGGGGHKHAAGFKVPWGHELAPVIDP